MTVISVEFYDVTGVSQSVTHTHTGTKLRRVTVNSNKQQSIKFMTSFEQQQRQQQQQISGGELYSARHAAEPRELAKSRERARPRHTHRTAV